MNRDTKKALIIVGRVYPEIVQVQVEDYCTDKKVIIINSNIEYIEKDEE